MVMDTKQHQERRFLGKTENFTDNNERHFYQRMLRAYLKGKQYFHYGFQTIVRNGVASRAPGIHYVEQKYSTAKKIKVNS